MIKTCSLANRCIIPSWEGLGVGSAEQSYSSYRRYPALVVVTPAVGVVCQVDDIVDQLEAANQSERPATEGTDLRQ